LGDAAQGSEIDRSKRTAIGGHRAGGIESPALEIITRRILEKSRGIGMNAPARCRTA
jgi:hypothetical protein